MMQVNSDLLLIRLNPAELIYAASIVSANRIYLFDSLAAYQSKEALASGQKSLVARGLCQVRSRDEIVLDTLLYGVLHWAIFPDWAVQFVVNSRYDQKVHTVFSKSGLLLVRENAGEFEFQIYRERKDVITTAFSMAGIQDQSEDGGAPGQSDIEFTWRFLFYRYQYSRPDLRGKITVVGNDRNLWLKSASEASGSVYSPMSASKLLALGIL